VSRVSIRRRAGRSQKSLTAAAQAVTGADGFKKSFVTGGDAGDWQEAAWKYTELVGELDYYVRWRSSSVSRCRLMASETDERGQPTGQLAEASEGVLTADSQTVQDIITQIGGSATGLAKILKRCSYILSVPGECWIAMLVRNPEREESTSATLGGESPQVFTHPEQWFVFDRSEIKTQGEDVVLTLPDGWKHTFDPAADMMFRIWDESPRNARLATSPVWSNRDTLNEIVRATATIDNASKSRLIGNGVLFIPQEISLPSQAVPMPLPATTAPPGTDPLPVMVGEHASAQDFQDLLFDVATAAMKDPNSIAAMLPIVASVPGEHIKNVQWIRPASDVPATALATREAAIKRLAMGLDVSPERLLGMGTNSNHWSAWAIDETDVKIHISPLVEMICDALTREVLWPKLEAENIDPDKYVVWYDTTDLTQDPDKGDEAKDAFDRGAISSSALREYLGLESESGYDLETTEGWLQLALDRVAADPDTVSVFGPILKELLSGKMADLVPIEVPGPPGSDVAPPTEQPAEPSAEPAGGPPDTAPAEVPLNAAAGMTVARLCVNRALELSGKRRRTRANSGWLADVPIERAHLVLGPVEYDEVEPLIKGWEAGLSDQDLIGLRLEPSAFRSMVRGVVTICLVTSSEPVLTPAMLRRMPDVPA
jgi:hypothetical protein